ncbi:MAG: hypothetical protein ACKOEO_19770 [Planctomycetaceae bacterium]
MGTIAFTDNHFADFFAARRRAGFASALLGFVRASASFRAMADKSDSEPVSAATAAAVPGFDAFTFGFAFTFGWLALDIPAGDCGAATAFTTAGSPAATADDFAGFLRGFAAAAFVGRVPVSAAATGTAGDCC